MKMLRYTVFSLISNGQRVRTKLIENYEGSLIDYGPKPKRKKGSGFINACFNISKRIIGKPIADNNFHVDEELAETEVTVLKLKKE